MLPKEVFQTGVFWYALWISCAEGAADLQGRTFRCAIRDTYIVFSTTWMSLSCCFILKADEGDELGWKLFGEILSS